MATFFVDSIDGASQVSKVDSTYSIPKARLYNFKTCVKDIMQSKAIQDQSFIVDGGISAQTVNTDEQGCLNWSEDIAYNFLAPSSYVQIQRTIIANGVHKGSTTIKLVLNPWSHGEDTSGVIDPSKKTITNLKSENESVSALISDGVKSPLWATGSKVTITQKELTATGASMSLKLQTKLSLVLKSNSLQDVQYPITNGVFDVEMILYNSVIQNGKETMVTLASGTQSGVTFTQDTLIAEFPFNLSILPSTGQIYMGVRITAPNNDIGLNPFEGVFMVSNNSNINIDSSLTPIQNQSFVNIKSQLTGQASGAPASPADAVKPGIEIDKLDIKFFKIGSENTTDRQVFFNVKACMKNNIDKSVIRNESFIVNTLSSKTPVTILSGQDGCVSWDDSIWHKFFGKEHFIKNTITISNANYNLNKSIDIMLDPWDTGSNFGQDGRFVDTLGALNANPSSDNAKILIDNYSFSVVKYGYEINKNLDLNLIKTGTLSLSAKVVNHSSLSEGRMGSESLRDGQYLLKWAVATVDDNEKANSIVSTGQKLVTVFGGDLKTDLGIKITAFDTLNVRSRLIVALYTVKESKAKNGIVEIDRTSGLDATPYAATIVLDNDQEGQKMQLIDNNFGLGKGDIFDRLASLGSSESNASVTIDKALASQNLKKINLANEKETQTLRDGLANPMKYYTQTQTPAYYHEAEQKPAVASSVLVSFAKTGKLTPDLAVDFCEYWFNDYFRRMKPDSKTGVLSANVGTGMTAQCIDTVRKDPSKFFSLDKKLLVKKVGNIKYISGTTTNFTVGTNFSVSKSESNTKSSSWSWTNTAGLSFEFFDVFKVGSSGSYAISSTKSKADTSNSSSSISASTFLNLQTSTFDIDLNSYEECASIKLNPSLFMGKGAPFANVWATGMKPQDMAKAATSGFFICTGANNNTNVTKRENYYLINQGFKSSHGEQDDNSLENQFFMTFRGQRDLMTFLNIIQSSTKIPGSANSFNQNTSSTFDNLNNGLSKLPAWPGAYTD